MKTSIKQIQITMDNIISRQKSNRRKNITDWGQDWGACKQSQRKKVNTYENNIQEHWDMS
jgi:hypothetical protein